jgi:hypothetical protein
MVSLNLYPILAQNAKLYENARLGLQVAIPYPPDWLVYEEQANVMFHSPDKSTIMKIGVGFGGDGDLEDFAEALIKVRRAESGESNFQVQNQGSTSINGKDFYSILSIIQDPVGQFKVLYLITEQANTVYMFELQSTSEQSYSEILPLFRQVVTSAQLSGTSPEDVVKQPNEDEEGQGEGLDPFEPNPDGQGGGFEAQKPGGGDNDGSDAFPQQQPPTSEPLCGPGSCIIS